MPPATPNSYNESEHYRSELRHLFVPSVYNFVAEATIAIIALLIFNFSSLNEHVLTASTGISANPLSVWGSVLNHWLSGAESAFVAHALLFAIWAIIGALAYVLAFRFLQIFVRARSSIQRGEQLIQADHAAGAWRYFASLHDFFLRAIIVVAGLAAILTGALLCFGVASQELSTALDTPFPSSLLNYVIALAGTLLTARVITVGLSLLFPRFRNWYNA